MEEKVYKLQEEITELYRTKAAAGDALIEAQSKKSDLESKLKQVQDDNEMMSSEIQAFKRNSADGDNTIKDLKM